MTTLMSEDAASFRYLVADGDDRSALARVFTARWCGKSEVAGTIKSCATAQSRVVHDNVLRVLDVFETAEGEPVVVTDFIDAPTAAGYLAAREPLDEVQATTAILQVLGAVAACHKKGLHHLGLRPDCVLLGRDQRDALCVRVTDFGMAKALPEDETHWAPEQHEGAATDARTDVYACGLLLYELLTGILPPEGALELRTTLPTLSLRLERALRRALSVEPRERFASADEMIAALSSEGLVQPVAASAPQLVSQERVRRPRRSLWIGALVASGLATAAVVAWQLFPAGDDAVAPTAQEVLGRTGAELSSRVGGQASARQSIPVPTDARPVPLDALPHQGTETGLVDLVLVTDLSSPFSSPLGWSFVPQLMTRYGENVVVAYLLWVPDELLLSGRTSPDSPEGSSDSASGTSRDGRLIRLRASVAADLQGAFLPFATALAERPELEDRSELLRLGESLGLDPRQLDGDLDGSQVDALLRHHHALLATLGAEGPGDVFVNGHPLSAYTSARLATLDAVTAAIDTELDQVQALLVQGHNADEVASLRTRVGLEQRPEAVPAEASPYRAPRWKLDLEGLPGLGPADAPLVVVLVADLSQQFGRDTLGRVLEFYRAHPDHVRLLVQLAPSLRSQEAFDLAVALLSARAAGTFWTVVENLRHGEQIASPHGTSATELFRVRAVEQGRQAALMSPSEEPMVFANGRRLAVELDALTAGLDEELVLVSNLLVGGLAADRVHVLADAASQPAPQPSPPEERRFVLANWQALPRLGPVDAPTKVFWQFSLYDADWLATYASMMRLREELGGDVAVCLVPTLALPSDPTPQLFARWWGREDEMVRADLDALAQIARQLPQGGDERTAAAATVFERLTAQRPTAQESQVDAQRSARVVQAIEAHTHQWASERATPGSVVIAWRSGLRFVGWTLPGGLAYEPYWDLARQARRAPR